MRRLLALIPDPRRPGAQPGGVLASSRAFLAREVADEFDVRIVDTTMRAYPVPDLREKTRAGTKRAVNTLRLLTAWKPEVAFAFCSERVSFYEKTALLLAARARGARTFLSPRSGMVTRWLAHSSAGRTWVRRVASELDGFVVQSEWWRDFYHDAGVPAHKLHVWYNSVDLEAWASVAKGRIQQTQARPFRFLFLGWAIAEKGLPELLEAGRIMARGGGPPFVLAVAGDGAVATQINSAPRPEWLEMLGWVRGDRLRDELACADALVLPSHAEGFPNAVLEAMACGLPVVVTPVGAVPEVVVDRETGLIVPVRSPDGLALAMDTFRRDPALAHAMGLGGLARARERFGRAAAATALARILSPAEPLRSRAAVSSVARHESSS